MGYDVFTFEDDGVMKEQSDAIDMVEKELRKGYQLVFSYNYFSVLNPVCASRIWSAQGMSCAKNDYAGKTY